MSKGTGVSSRSLLALGLGIGILAACEGAGLVWQSRRQEAIARACNHQVELMGEALSLNQDVSAIHGKAQVLVRRMVAAGVGDAALDRRSTELVERLGEVGGRLAATLEGLSGPDAAVDPGRAARMRQEWGSAREDFMAFQSGVLKAAEGAASEPGAAAGHLDEATAAYRAFNEHLRNLAQEAVQATQEGEVRLRQLSRIRIQQSAGEAFVLLAALGVVGRRWIRRGQRQGTVGRAAMEALTHPSLVTDCEGRVLAWNPSFWNEIRKPEAEVDGGRVEACLPVDLLEAFEAGVEALRRTGLPSTTFTRHREEAGATLCLELSMKPLSSCDGSLEGVLTRFREVRSPGAKGSAPVN